MKVLILTTFLFYIINFYSVDGFTGDKLAERDNERKQQMSTSKPKATTGDAEESTTHHETESHDASKSPKSKESGHDKKKHSKDGD